MSKTLITFLVITLIHNLGMAQRPETQGQNLQGLLNDKMVAGFGTKESQKLYSDDFSKNPFIFKDWNKGQMSFKDGTEVDSLMLNFDDSSGDLLVKIADGVDPFMVKTRQVVSFKFYHAPDREFIGKTKNDFTKNEKQFAFYEKLFGNDGDQEITVLKLYVKEFRDKDEQLTYGSLRAEDKFDLFTRYYIKSGNTKYSKFSLNKKGFQEIIGKPKIKEAQALLRSNKLKWTDEAAIAIIFNEFLEK